MILVIRTTGRRYLILVTSLIILLFLWKIVKMNFVYTFILTVCAQYLFTLVFICEITIGKNYLVINFPWRIFFRGIKLRLSDISKLEIQNVGNIGNIPVFKIFLKDKKKYSYGNEGFSDNDFKLLINEFKKREITVKVIHR